MRIKTSEIEKVKELFKQINLPKSNSHKGQNGKVLIIGGSSLFHAASLWAAEVCSHFADMVHYSSTVENEKIFHELKKIFRNGIIVPNSDLDSYVSEDDVILVGPGMMRIGKEGVYTKNMVNRLITKFPNKKFVFDAGALQMMDKDWLKMLKTQAIITPHQKEFEKLFGITLENKELEEKEKIIRETAKKYNVTVLFKAVYDIVSDGDQVLVIDGGNSGLTKGGTGDVLAGLTASFYTKNNSLLSGIVGSLLIKLTSENLYKTKGYWYNINDIINRLPNELTNIVL